MSVNARLNVNVALNRPSYQVSTLTEDPDHIYYPKYANDGNNATNMRIDRCAATRIETNPWWTVDLGVALHVHGVKFTNRNFKGTYNYLFYKDLGLMAPGFDIVSSTDNKWHYFSGEC